MTAVTTPYCLNSRPVESLAVSASPSRRDPPARSWPTARDCRATSAETARRWSAAIYSNSPRGRRLRRAAELLRRPMASPVDAVREWDNYSGAGATSPAQLATGEHAAQGRARRADLGPARATAAERRRSGASNSTNCRRADALEPPFAPYDRLLRRPISRDRLISPHPDATTSCSGVADERRESAG